MQLKRIFIIIALCLGLVNSVFAAELVTSIESTNIDFGKSFQLKILLTGAEAVEPLDVSNLAQNFIIYGQQQYSSYVSTNGKVTAETGWNITVLPRNEGPNLIPSMSVKTDKGLVKSNEIKINVKQPGGNQVKADDVLGVSLISSVSKAQTYIKQPIIYTLKIIAYKPVINLGVEEIKSNDAIIEKIGDLKQYTQNLGGVNAAILEVSFAITPLKVGKIKIIPAVVHGEVQEPIPHPQAQRFGIYNQMFFDQGFNLKPFSVKGEEITINALEIPSQEHDVLALTKLTLTEKWDGLNQAKVGDTFTRKITMLAQGSFGSQLPNLKHFMEINDVKIYSNKPITIETIDQKGISVTGRKEEEFSLVAQKAGKITFPEVRIKWWNTATKQLEESVLPAKTIEVLPGTGAMSANNTLIDYSSADDPVTITEPAAKPVEQVKSNNYWLYILITSLLGIIIGLFVLVIYLLGRKPKAIIVKPVQQPIKTKVSNALELREIIIEYAINRWRAPQDISLNKLGAYFSEQNFSYDVDTYVELSNSINASLYAKSKSDVPELLALWEVLKNSVVKNSTKEQAKSKDIDYSDLNPT